MRLSGAGRYALRFVAGADTTERPAALVSTVAVGRSFGPGLLPCSGLDQAVVTGVVAAIEYGLVVTSQSLFGGLARSVLRNGDTAVAPRRFVAQAATDSALAATGLAVERLLRPRPEELLRRAAVRTLGRRFARVGSAGLIVAAVAVAAVDELSARDGSRPLRLLAAASGVGVGATVSAW